MALAFVNAATGAADGGSTTIAAGAASHTTGNLLVVKVIWTSGSATLNSISDTAGNTYTRHTSSKATSSNDHIETFYAQNITGNASNVVTATLSASSTFRRIVVLQYSGAATSSSADTQGVANATSATATSASFTTAQADEVIVTAVGCDTTSGWGAGAAGTLRVNNLGTDSAAEDQIVSSTGSYTGSMTADFGSVRWWITSTTYKAVASGAYSLDAQPGSFSVTGAASGVVSGRVISANPGSYAITGTAASLVAGRVINASPGSYAITGNAAGLIADRILSANPGSYVITGIDATFVYDTGSAAYVLSADPGSFVVTGFDAGVPADRVLSASPGSFAITGADAAVVAARLLSALPGSFTITGFDGGTLIGRVLSADPGSFTITGSVAALVPPASGSQSSGPSRRVIHIRFGVYP